MKIVPLTDLYRRFAEWRHLDSFERTVLDCKKGRRDFSITDLSTDHVEFLIRALLEQAIEEQGSVYVVMDEKELSAGYYNNNLELFERVLAHSHVFVVALCDKETFENSRFYKALGGHRNIGIHIAPEQTDIDPFLVAGHSGYRKMLDCSTRRAMTNFFNPERVRDLRAEYMAISAQATPYQTEKRLVLVTPEPAREVA